MIPKPRYIGSGDAYMRQLAWSPLIHIGFRRLFDTKPVAEPRPTRYQLDQREQNTWQIAPNVETHQDKYRKQNDFH